MDRARDLIRKRIAEKGLDMAKVSKAIGRNHAYMQQYLNLGKPKELPERVREALASELGISQDILREPRNATDKPENRSLTTVTDNGQPGEAQEEQIMELLKFLQKLRHGQEDVFDEAVARLFKEKPGQTRPQLVGRTS